jgi:hypothetical protein
MLNGENQTPKRPRDGDAQTSGFRASSSVVSQQKPTTMAGNG